MTFVVFGVYQLTIVLLPLTATRIGYGEAAAGSLTASFMAGAVLGPVLGTRLFRWPGVRATILANLIVQAALTAAIGAAGSLWQLLALNACRGAVFGLLAAALPVVVMRAVPAAGQGRALGYWGLVCTVPAVVAPTAAVMLVDRASLGTTALVAGAVACLALPPLAWPREWRRWPGAAGAPERPPHTPHPLAAMGRPAAVFLCATVTYGAVVSFMPLLLTGGRATVGASVAFLLAMGCALPPGRVLGGRRPRGALLLGSALGGAGLAAVLVSGAVAVSLPAGLAYGLGFGMVTTASQVELAGAGPAADPVLASVVFSVLFNTGIGFGGLGAGVVGELVGLRFAFALCVGLCLLAAAVILAGRRPAASRAPAPRARW